MVAEPLDALTVELYLVGLKKKKSLNDSIFEAEHKKKKKWWWEGVIRARNDRFHRCSFFLFFFLHRINEFRLNSFDIKIKQRYLQQDTKMRRVLLR
jgi:hypothetical protein